MAATPRSHLKLLHQGRVLKSFTLKDACRKKFHENPLLSEIEGGTILNCMGKTFNPRTLCEGEELLDSSFTRALVSKDNSSIICEFASSVKINLNCDHALIQGNCNISPGTACKGLANSYAKDLRLVHSSIIKVNEIKMVDCHFSTSLF